MNISYILKKILEKTLLFSKPSFPTDAICPKCGRYLRMYIVKEGNKQKVILKCSNPLCSFKKEKKED